MKHQHKSSTNKYNVPIEVPMDEQSIKERMDVVDRVLAKLNQPTTEEPEMKMESPPAPLKNEPEPLQIINCPSCNAENVISPAHLTCWVCGWTLSQPETAEMFPDVPPAPLKNEPDACEICPLSDDVSNCVNCSHMPMHG